MDPQLVKEIFDLLIKGEYPKNFSKHQRYSLRRRSSNFSIIDGDLYYTRNKGSDEEVRAKVVRGAEEADELFIQFHSSGIGAHCGQLKTRDAISQRFYWPGMSRDIERWVSQCTVCQKNKGTLKTETQYTPIKTKVPFELVGMDLIGKLVMTEEKNQYTCVMIDYCTRWTQAYALKSKTAKEVTECILKFVYQFEVPKRILTDQGKEFVNTINTEVCQALGIKRSLCAPYHPQTNGLVERCNGTIQRALAKLVDDKPNTWDRYLDAVMFGLRTKKQLTTRFSPYFLMFGREARYPFEVPEQYQIDHSIEDKYLEEEVTFDIERQEKLLKIVQDNVERVQEKTRRHLRSKTFGQRLQVGDMVWRKNVRSQQRKGGKLEPEFLGPFTVTRIEGKSVDLVDGFGKATLRVNIDHLKLHTEEVPRIPSKLKEKAKARVPTSPSAKPPSPPTQTTSPAAEPPSPPTPTTSPAAKPPSPPTPTNSPAAKPASPPTPATSSAAKPASPPTPATSPAAKPASPPTPATSSAAESSSPPTPTTSAYPSSSLPTAVSTTPLLASATVSTSPPAVSLLSCVNEAWEGKNVHVLLSRIGPYKIFYWDITRTAPDQELESEVINAYLLRLVQHHNQRNEDNQALFIDSYEMTSIWQKKTSRLKCNPGNFNVILGAVHEPGHWILTAMFPKLLKSLVLGSLGHASSKLKTCLESTRAFMRKHGCQVSRWKAETMPHSLQPDGSSCGIFVLKYAEKILAEEPLIFSTTRSAVCKYRKKVAVKLLKQTDDLRELCHYCGEKISKVDSDDPQNEKHTDWIQCDACGRWYHLTCVGTTDTSKEYCCLAC
ncbi:uncharacterized protein [Paramormyrops kingsleyae]|uniref:uncharacterized protein isoform X1 n=1 Tax=Paramormyrops kingsleyae TaxID=1676925 RepID=UPI003B96BF71